MAKVRIEYDGRKLKKNTANLGPRIDRAAAMIVDRNAAWGQGYMRMSAPWTDNTGAARGGLFTFPQSSGGHHEITFSHSVHYGIWLEIANSGKYQVIMPSVRVTGAHLMADLRRLMELL